MYADLQATQRNHNAETTELRRQIRSLESQDQAPQDPEQPSRDDVVLGAMQNALANNFLKRVCEATALTLFQAAKREMEHVDQLRADAKRTETITPSSAEVLEAVSRNLYNLAVEYGNHHDPLVGH